MTTAVLDLIAAQRVLPVVRALDAEDAQATARACGRAGMTVVELTLTTPDVERALAALREEGELVLGLGSVTRAEQVRQGVAAGARFVVSFAAVEGMVEQAAELGATAIPGALTPTEVLRGLHAGAPAIKLFPARLAEPAYLGDLHAVMPGLRVLVTGGVEGSAQAIGPWLEAGALAVGVGSDLGSAARHGADEVERRARELLAACATG